jgi:hypothetical protein
MPRDIRPFTVGQHSKKMVPSIHRRQKLVNDTLERSASIIEKTPTATADSTFVAEQIPALSHDSSNFPNNPTSKIRVMNIDSFTAVRGLASEFGMEATRGKLAVLNMANDQTPGGGWRSFATAQVRFAPSFHSTTTSSIFI